MNSGVKTVVFWLVICISALLLFQVVKSGKAEQQMPEISYSQFVSQAEAGEVAKVTIAGSRIQGQYRNGGQFRASGPSNPSPFLAVLHDKGVEVWFKDASDGSWPLQLMGTWAPLILLAALWFFMIRQMQKRSRPQNPGQASQAGPGFES